MFSDSKTKDPRENLVDLSAPGVWEADNRVEERWQWGSQVTDLCGLSPEEYKNSTAIIIKTIQDCGDCGSGSTGSDECFWEDGGEPGSAGYEAWKEAGIE